MKASIKPFTLWILGPTSSGKTTLAQGLLPILKKQYGPVLHFDGDEFRNIFGKDHGFKSSDRLKVVKAIIHFAQKAVDAGCICLVSALTAHENARELVRQSLSPVCMCYVKCNLLECMRRDPKGLYKKAQEGEINTLLGYNTEYIAPKNCEITIDTSKMSVEENIQKILIRLQSL